MTEKALHLNGKVVCIYLQSSKNSEGLGGKIILRDFPNELDVLLQEQEELVNDQVFSLLDDIEIKIASYQLLYENELVISDLQVFDDQVSFSINGNAPM